MVDSRLGALPIIVTFAATACTHLETSMDYRTDGIQQAVTGVPYALPALQYDLTITNSIASCPRQFEVEAGGQRQAFSDGAFALATKVVPVASYIAGERFIADYQSLASPFKTTGYGLEVYPNGVLKSINVSAEDQSGPFIKDIVGIGLSVAGMVGSGGGAGIMSDAGGLSSMGITEAQVDDELSAALAGLLQGPAVKTVFCRADTERMLAERGGSGKAVNLASEALAITSEDVSRLSVITGNRRSNRDDLLRLDKALADQGRLELLLASLVEASGEAAAKLSMVSKKAWPNAETDIPKDGRVSGSIMLGEGEMLKLARLLEIRTTKVVDRSKFLNWWHQQSPTVQSRFRMRYADIAEAYGVHKNPVPLIAASQAIFVCTDHDVQNCIDPQLTYRATLSRFDNRIQNGPPSSARPLLVTQKNAARGVLIRTSQLADFELCRGTLDANAQCPESQKLTVQRGVSAPQLGQLRFLPFSNRMFEAAQLSLSMREDGSVEKLEYKRTKSIAGGASAAIKDALDQYEAFRDKQDKKSKDDRAAARAESIAALQYQVDVLAKQKELLKLQQPDAPDLVQQETAAINAQVALLNAKLARQKAEAALAGPME